MKERLEAAKKYERALILYEEGKITHAEIYNAWMDYVGPAYQKIAEELTMQYIKDKKLRLT